MRRSTLITGVILIALGAVFTAYLTYEYETPLTAQVEVGHFTHAEMIRSVSPWWIDLTWWNSSSNSSSNGAAAYTFFVSTVRPTGCTDPSEVVASGNGSSGSLSLTINGHVRFYVFECDGSGHYAGFDTTLTSWGFSYYMTAGIGLLALGVGATIFAFFQKPAPPLLRIRAARAGPSDPPSAK